MQRIDQVMAQILADVEPEVRVFRTQVTEQVGQ